jgi:molybdopterin biosynthesis enzyme
MEQRIVSRKTRGWKALRLGEDWYSQLVVPPGPNAEMDDYARK